MDFFTISPNEYKLFLLILIRVSIILYLFPIFSTPMFPTLPKVGLSLVMSILLFPIIKINLSVFPDTTINLVMLIVGEFFIGMTLGLSVRLFFGAAELAGRLIGFQMGFAMINVVDPQSGAQVSLMEQIGYYILLLLFLALNGHHLLILALIQSFDVIHIGGIVLQKKILVTLMNMVSDMFSLSIQMGAPAVAALLFVSASFGIVAKFLPQMNILIVGFPVKIIVGLIFFSLSLYAMVYFTQVYVDQLPAQLLTLMKWIAGG